MCCSVKNEFVQALESLLAKEHKPDYIVIETTGEIYVSSAFCNLAIIMTVRFVFTDEMLTLHWCFCSRANTHACLCCAVRVH